MAKVIIFGVVETAELAYYYLTHDSEHEVVAFCVHQEYMPKNKFFQSLPIIDFETVEQSYPKDEYKFFAPMSPVKMNTVRENIYNEIKDKGYSCISYISSRAIVFNSEIGENCFIQEGNTLQPYSKIGNNVMLWSDSTIAHHSIINDHVTLAAHVIVNGHCEIGENCFLALNSSVAYGIHVAKGTHVKMGTVISKDTNEWSVYSGNPAVEVGK